MIDELSSAQQPDAGAEGTVGVSMSCMKGVGKGTCKLASTQRSRYPILIPSFALLQPPSPVDNVKEEGMVAWNSLCLHVMAMCALEVRMQMRLTDV